MTPYTVRLLSTVLCCLISVTVACAEDGTDEKLTVKQIEFFEKKIRPVLSQHCYKCHAADSKHVNGGVLLDSRDGIRRGGDAGCAVVPGDVEKSHLIGALTHESFEVPLKGKLDDAIINDFVHWIEIGAADPRDGKIVVSSAIDFDEARKLSTFQPVTFHALRPLNHSVSVIFKTRCLECHDSDSKSGGIDLEARLEAFDAEKDVDDWAKIEHAIVSGKMPPPSEAILTELQKQEFNAWFNTEFVMPEGVLHPGPNLPRRVTREELQNTLEDILHVDLRVTVTNSRLHVIPDTIIEKFFSAGVIGDSGFSNDAVTLSQESIDIQTYSRCFSLVLSLLDSNEKARKQLFGQSSLPKEFSTEDARPLIESFARSAWRRKGTTEEITALTDVFKQVSQNESSYEGLKASMLAALLSPSFLFRLEDTVAVAEGSDDTAAPPTAMVSPTELAVRLSYFLWSAPPDEELTRLAENGTLQDDEVLRQQVRRMLADTNRVALAENLGGEWFDYKKLRQQSAVNQRSDRMAGFYRTQFEEALLFFDSVIRYRQPIFSLIDADWTYLNGHQKSIYGMQTEAKSFEVANVLPPINLHYRNNAQQVHTQNYEYKHAPLTVMKLTDSDRGGFVTLGSTMSVTSTENRTSPIRRGVWVMERVLGQHLEVPEDVPDLEETKKKAKVENRELTNNELLKLHSSQVGCAACHQYIDPIGFGLEAFDQLGISRTITDTNPSGEKITWTPTDTPKSYTDHSWTIAEPLVPGKETRVFFQYTKGAHRLNIRDVRLTAGDHSIEDKHFGFTGEAKHDNVWFFPIPDDAPATSWNLTAEIQGDGGTDSHGIITIAGPGDTHPGYELPNGNTFRSPAELKQLLLSDYRVRS